MRKKWWLAWCVSGAVVMTACGSKDPEVDDAGARGGRGGSRPDGGGGSGRDAGGRDSGRPGDDCKDGAYLPMAVGNSWTYKVISPTDGVSTKVNTIDDEEKVGGSGPNANKTAFHALTQKTSAAGMDMTESWQGVLEDGSVVRYRELSYRASSSVVNNEEHWAPYKLRFDNSDEHVAEDAKWNEKYSETKIADSAPVTAERNDGWVVEGVDVPCGPVNGEMLSCLRVRKTSDGADTGKTYWYARCVGKVREMGTQVEELTDYELH